MVLQQADLEIDYYDKVLAGMAGSLALGAGVAVATSVPVQYAVGTGAAASIAIMYHGMFRNRPMG